MSPKNETSKESRSSYSAHDFEAGPLAVGDRVIIKEKYIGTARYVGPIEEKIVSDEIFIGIELDEEITKNSGVFGSRQYFDCEYGHGIMVPMSKVRKLKDFSKKETKSTEKTRTMRSKSISDIHRLKLRDENGKTLRKVSPGYDYIKRSKSSSNLSRAEIQIHKGTFEILEDYKNYQEKERDLYKNIYQSRHYNDIDQIYDTMGLEYPPNLRQDRPHPDWDQMRQSFLKIVSPRRHMSCATSIVDESFPNRASMASLDSGNFGTFPEYSAYDDRSFINSPNSSRRTSAVIKPRRSREVVTVRKYAFSADQLSDSSGVESYDDKISKPQKISECAEEPILKAMVALRKNICEDCLNCKKCAPAEYIPVDEVEKIKYLPMNTCPEVATKSKSRRRSKSKPRRKDSGIDSKTASSDHPVSIADDWKKKHGCSMEKGMKRGFNKLMYAINA